MSGTCNPDCHYKYHSECPIEYNNDTSDIYCMDDPRPDEVQITMLELNKEIYELLSWIDADIHLVIHKPT